MSWFYRLPSTQCKLWCELSVVYVQMLHAQLLSENFCSNATSSSSRRVCTLLSSSHRNGSRDVVRWNVKHSSLNPICWLILSNSFNCYFAADNDSPSQKSINTRFSVLTCVFTNLLIKTDYRELIAIFPPCCRIWPTAIGRPTRSSADADKPARRV